MSLMSCSHKLDSWKLPKQQNMGDDPSNIQGSPQKENDNYDDKKGSLSL